MLKVFVKKGDPNGLEKALRKFKKICFETEQEWKKHEYYLRPGLRKMQKSKLALQRKWKEEKENAKRKQKRNYKNTRN